MQYFIFPSFYFLWCVCGQYVCKWSESECIFCIIYSWQPSPLLCDHHSFYFLFCSLSPSLCFLSHWANMGLFSLVNITGTHPPQFFVSLLHSAVTSLLCFIFSALNCSQVSFLCPSIKCFNSSFSPQSAVGLLLVMFMLYGSAAQLDCVQLGVCWWVGVCASGSWDIRGGKDG